MFTLKQLQTFHSICRSGGFVAAAARLHTTQTAVSMRIQDLENGLGVKLFDRSRRSATLTPKGRDLLRQVEQLISLVADIESAMSDPRALSGTVRLGASDFVAATWLPKLLAAIHNQSPGITLELNVDLGPNVFKKLQEGEVEVAIVPGPILAAGFKHTYVGEVEFAWMASKTLGVPKRLKAADLASWPLLSLPPSSNSYRLLDEWLEANNVKMRRTHVCNSHQILVSLTKAGVGISHLPLRHMKREIDAGELVVLDVRPPLPKLPYYVMYNRHYASTLVTGIASLARKHSGFLKSK